MDGEKGEERHELNGKERGEKKEENHTQRLRGLSFPWTGLFVCLYINVARI